MVSPQAKRQCVGYLVAEKTYSERRACQLVGIARSSHRYRAKPAADEQELRAKIRDLAVENKPYGYRTITALLRRDGWRVNKKRVHRIWQTEGLQQPRHKPRKRYYGPKGEVKQKANYPNHVWSYDFAEDRTEKGGKLRILSVMDEFTRESLAIRVERSIKAVDVIDTLEWLILVRGAPAHMRSDNGPEFVARAVQDWLNKRACQTIYIMPGSPWENPYIESFIGTLRRECLDRYLFINGREAQQIIAAWQHEYNYFRPHSSLNYLTPAEFARQQLAVAGLVAATALPACGSRPILPL